MLNLAVRDVHPHDSLILGPLIKQDPLYGVGVAPLQDHDGVVHPHKPREAEGLHRTSPVAHVHEAQERERRRSSCMDPLDCALGSSQELWQGAGLPWA